MSEREEDELALPPPADQRPPPVPAAAQPKRPRAEPWRLEAQRTSVRISKEVRRLIDAGKPIPPSLIAAARAYNAVNLEGGALLGRVDGRDADTDA